MFRFYMIMIVMHVFTALCAIDIISIDNISGGKRVLENFDYTGTIFRYENRLYVQDTGYIEEFEILPDGRLEQISYTDVRSDLFSTAIHSGRLYLMKENHFDDLTRIKIFDITVSPMQWVTSFNIEGFVFPKFLFYDNHLLIVNNERDRIKTTIYNIENFQEVSNINGFGGFYLEIFGNNFVDIFHFHDEDDRTRYFLKFFDIVDLYKNDFYEVSELILPDHVGSPYDLVVVNDMIILSHHTGVSFIDISNPSEPQMVNDFALDYPVRCAVYTENRLFVSYSYPNNKIHIFDIDDKGNLIQIDTLKNSQLFSRNLYHDHPYVYINNGDLNIFDTTTGELNLLFKGGMSFGNYLEVNAPTKDNFYYVKKAEKTLSYNIFSAFSEDIVCTIDFDIDIFDEYTYSMLQWYMTEDKLYISFQDELAIHNFRIYEIKDQKASLFISQVTKHTNVYLMYVSGDKVFFGTYDPYVQYVYQLTDNLLEEIGSFNGIIQYNHHHTSNEHIFGLHNGYFTIREVNDINAVIFEKWVGYRNASVIPYDSNYVIFNSSTSQWLNNYSIYDYSIKNSTLNSFHKFPLIGYLNNYNKIISIHDGTKDLTEFFTIINNKLVKIGEKTDTMAVSNLFFYPEKRKIVKMTFSGIWVYDFDYSVSDSDVVTEVHPTGLIGNYPNPFNPETVIKFGIRNSEFGINSSHSSGLPHYAVGGAGIHARIDIYNIKGQKVRSLVDGYYAAGEHSVVWNGKDDSGVGVGSGVYFYRLTTPNFTETKKMVMIK